MLTVLATFINFMPKPPINQGTPASSIINFNVRTVNSGKKRRDLMLPEVRKWLIFRYGSHIIALLRCLIRERFYTFCTLRVACAASSLRSRIHTEHTVDGTPPQARLMPAFLTESVKLVTYERCLFRTFTNDRMDGERTPLCATLPDHRGFNEELPCRYPIFPFFCTERG